MTTIVKVLLFFGDMVLLNFAILVSVFWQTDNFRIENVNDIYLLIFSNLSWLFLILVSTPYNVTKGWSISKILKSQMAFIFIHSLIVVSLVFFFKKQYPILQILSLYLLFIPAFFLVRGILFYLKNVLTDKLLSKNYILIGRNELSYEIRKYYLMNPSSGMRFKGYFEYEAHDFDLPKVQRFCEERDVHEIHYCLPNPPRNELDQLVAYGLDSLIKVKLIVERNFTDQGLTLDNYDVQPGLNKAIVPLDDLRNQWVKRIFDLIFSGLFAILILSWLIPIIGLIIKMDSKGPIFFTQLRSGEGNKSFKCLKFRSMMVNKDADSKQATEDDPRITKLGTFLRKSSIDELPQFLNVLMGTMSVVGPRPHMLKHTEEYSKLIEKFMGRHYIKPGITGLAQCMGYRGETRTLADMENRVRLDRYYIENWTFWLDIKIIFLTVVSLLRGSDKAY